MRRETERLKTDIQRTVCGKKELQVAGHNESHLAVGHDGETAHRLAVHGRRFVGNAEVVVARRLRSPSRRSEKRARRWTW